MILLQAVFNSKIAVQIPAKIATAAIQAGAPAAAIPATIGAIAGNDAASLSGVQGVTPAVIAAAVAGYLEAFATSFHYVWYSAIPFCVISVIRKSDRFSEGLEPNGGCSLFLYHGYQPSHGSYHRSTFGRTDHGGGGLSQ